MGPVQVKLKLRLAGTHNYLDPLFLGWNFFWLKSCLNQPIFRPNFICCNVPILQWCNVRMSECPMDIWQSWNVRNITFDLLPGQKIKKEGDRVDMKSFHNNSRWKEKTSAAFFAIQFFLIAPIYLDLKHTRPILVYFGQSSLRCMSGNKNPHF